MKRTLPIVLAVLTVVLIAAATIRPKEGASSKSPEGAVQAMFSRLRAHDYAAAYDYVAQSSNTDEKDFASDLAGRDGSLRTYSALHA